jgi:dephospho-CoA kinase
MLLIGLTGGIGAGKTLVSRVFGVLGVPVYSADDRAKELLNDNPDLRARITDLLGTQAYAPAGTYDRPWVAARVFGQPELLEKLNALVHPRVRQDGLDWAARHAGHPYVLYEAALMNAAGEGNAFAKVIVVEAPETLRVARVRMRDPQRSEAEIRAILARQKTDAERRQLADFVLVNDEQTPLLGPILDLHARLTTLGKSA